jgi:hypothetical protein
LSFSAALQEQNPMNAMGPNVDAAALQVQIGSYDLTVMRITAKSVPHSRGEDKPVRDENATSTGLGIPGLYILRHQMGVKMMLKD